MEARIESVAVDDGAFDLPVWLPASGRGPGILLIQEIFGVGTYIRQVAEDLAGRGYVVGAPDLFWRIQPRWEAVHDDAGVAASMGLAQQFDFAGGIADCNAALAHLSQQPEVSGGLGAVGFCLGGSLGYFLAAGAEAGSGGGGGLDALVSFYGSRVPDATDRMPDIRCPALFVFGGSDPFITRHRVALVEEAAAGRSNLVVRVFEEAGHAFHNFDAPMFHHPESEPLAWAVATDFLAEHLRPGD